MILHMENLKKSTLKVLLRAAGYKNQYIKINCGGFPGGLVIENPPANAGSWVQSPGPGDSTRSQLSP